MAGPNVRVIVELNDMTYGNHYEILVDLLRSSQPATPPPPPPAPAVLVGGRTETATVDDRRRQSQNDLTYSSTWEGFGNLTSSASSAAFFRGGKTGGKSGRSQRKGWLSLFRVGRDSLNGPRATQGGERSDPQGSRQSQQRSSVCGSTADGGSATLSPAGAAAAKTAVSPGRAKEGQRARVHWTLTKGVASGAIVPSSLPETLLCQAFYNPAIIMIVEALLDPKGQCNGKVEGSEDIKRRRIRSRENRCVLEPECKDGGNADYKRGATEGEGVAGGPGGGRNRDERQGRGWGRGEASFLAQILPPKRFFTQATLGGHRPNFQVNTHIHPR